MAMGKKMMAKKKAKKNGNGKKKVMARGGMKKTMMRGGIKSVKQAKPNIKNGIQSPRAPGRKNVKINIGTKIIRPIVNMFGILSFIFFNYEKNHVFFLLPKFLYLLPFLGHQN